MATVEGTHARGGNGPAIHYRVDYQVVGHTIHFRATFDRAGALHQGQLDIDPSRLRPAAAVDAFIRNHIEKSDWDVAP